MEAVEVEPVRLYCFSALEILFMSVLINNKPVIITKAINISSMPNGNLPNNRT